MADDISEPDGSTEAESPEFELELDPTLFDRFGVRELLVQALQSAAALGFMRVTREKRDLPQARLAIEALRALEPVLREAGVDATLVADLEQARTNLQLAYAKAVAEEGESSIPE